MAFSARVRTRVSVGFGNEVWWDHGSARPRFGVVGVFGGLVVQLFWRTTCDTRLGCSVFGSSVSCLAI